MSQQNHNFLDLQDLELLVNKLEETYSCDIICNYPVLKEVTEKVNYYLGDFDDPSAYKVSGAITFWLRKLKPFSFQLSEESIDPTLFLNEIVSVFYGYNYLRAYSKNKGENYPSLSGKFLKDLIVQLRYSSFSPSSITMLFWALCHER